MAFIPNQLSPPLNPTLSPPTSLFSLEDEMDFFPTSSLFSQGPLGTQLQNAKAKSKTQQDSDTKVGDFSYFNKLTRKIQRNILMFLSGIDLGKTMCSCRLMRDLCFHKEVMIGVLYNTIKMPPSFGQELFYIMSTEECYEIFRDILAGPSGGKPGQGGLFGNFGLSMNNLGNLDYKGSVVKKIPMFAYFTDGGTDQNNLTYFISNIFLDGAKQLYASTAGYNIHVKALFSEELVKTYEYKDPSKYKVAMNPEPEHATYKINYKKQLEKLGIGEEFAIMKGFELQKFIFHYTCFLQSFVLFVSMYEIDEKDAVVQLFNDKKNSDTIEEMGFDVFVLQEETNTKIIEFNLTNLSRIQNIVRKEMNIPEYQLGYAYPLIYGNVVQNIPNSRTLNQRIAFRHILFKLIDSHKTQADGNIDVYSTSIKGTVFSLSNSTEE